MADIQKQVENRVDQLDTQNKLRDKTAAQAIIYGIRNNIPSIDMSNYESLGYKERLGKPNAEKINQLNAVYQKIRGEMGQVIKQTQTELENEKVIHQYRRKVEGKTPQTTQELRNYDKRITSSDGTTGAEALKGIQEYRATIAQSKEFEEFNDEMKKILGDALDGQLIEGGVIGLIKSIVNKMSGRNLQRKLNKLRDKFPNIQGLENFQQNYINSINEHKETLNALLAIKGGKQYKYANGDILSKLFAYKDKKMAYEIFDKPEATFIESRNRAVIDILLMALGSANGGINVVFGHLKTPFIKAYHPVPDKDIIGKHFLGRKGTETLEAEMRAGEKATGKLADLLKSGQKTEYDAQISQGVGSAQGDLEERINWSDDRVEDSLSKAKRILFGGSLGSFFGQLLNSNLRTIASNINKIDSKSLSFGEKSAALEKAIIGLEREQSLEIAKGKNRTIGEMIKIQEAIDAARFLKSRIDNHLRLGNQGEAIESGNPGIKKLAGVLTQYRTYEDFAQENTVHPDAVPFFKLYYKKGSYNGRKVDANFLYTSSLTPGVMEFMRVRGNPSAYRIYKAQMDALDVAQMSGRNAINYNRTKHNEYWNPGQRFSDANDLRDAITNANVENQPLLALMTSQIYRLTGAHVSPSELRTALGGATPNTDPNLKFGNSGPNSPEAKGGKTLDDAFIVRIPKTVEVNRANGAENYAGDIIIGIKPGCMNIQILHNTGNFVRWEEARYAGQATPEHLRVILQYLFKSKSSSPKNVKERQSNRPHKPRPKEPVRPGEPEVPTETPVETVNSTIGTNNPGGSSVVESPSPSSPLPFNANNPAPAIQSVNPTTNIGTGGITPSGVVGSFGN